MRPRTTLLIAAVPLVGTVSGQKAAQVGLRQGGPVKVMLIVQREAGTTDTAWVVDAADEYTLDEWDGRLPDQLQARIDADPANVRPLWIEIPDNAFERLWNVPTVTGQVRDA
jgi:ABC-type amino acid transport substrate-binding protein